PGHVAPVPREVVPARALPRAEGADAVVGADGNAGEEGLDLRRRLARAYGGRGHDRLHAFGGQGAARGLGLDVAAWGEVVEVGRPRGPLQVLERFAMSHEVDAHRSRGGRGELLERRRG